MKNKILLLSALVAMIFITGCQKDKPVVTPDEQEVITRVVLNFKDDNGITKTFQWQQPGGTGTPVTVSDILLKAGSEYDLTIQMFSKVQNAEEEITSEIKEKGEEHFFIFDKNTSNLTFQILDTDAKGLPVGLESKVTTGSAGEGVLKITLKHGSDKSKPESTGDTDWTSDFNVQLQ